ncbi:hypothetical protein N9D23_01455 [Rubripirellula sp.]|jgi:hypothetical protein|nr:hypothetical protein [Rubripirellula sp.]MDF1845346.1 hypothetical protein [Rubripirellula sp.]
MMKMFVDRLLLLSLMLVVLALLATSAATLWGEALGGSTLMLHMTAGGALVVGMPLVALWFLRRGVIRQAANAMLRCGYWLTILTATATIITVFLCMLPLPSTDQMNELMELHGYAGFAMVPAVALFSLAVVRSRRMKLTRSATPG